VFGHEDCFGCGNKCLSKFFGGHFDKNCEAKGTTLLTTLDTFFYLLYAPCESTFETHLQDT